MEKLEQQVRNIIRKYRMIAAGERVLAGVSGGADSVCLLFVLLALRKEMDFSLSVVHVNHGMRAAADGDEAFVRRLADESGVPFHAAHIDVPALQKRWKSSPEEAARHARYGAFARILRETGAGRLAVAHNRGDQAETVLFKLFRGAGLRGFAGMAPVQEFAPSDGEAAYSVIRPLLFTPRGEIEAYLRRQGLAHVEDESNASDVYARNRIRGQLLPYAEDKINTAAEAHLAGAASRAREALAFIEEEARARCGRMRLAAGGGDICLNAALLRQETVFMQKEILLFALREAGAAREIGERHIAALVRLAASGSGTQALDLPGGIRAVRAYDALTIGKIGRTKQTAEVLPLPIGGTLALSGAGTVRARVLAREAGAPVREIPADTFTKWFDCDKILKSIVFRKRQQGDWIDVGAGKKSLKKEMIDRRIPAAMRDDVWLMAAGDEILWIAGIRRCEAYRVTEETRRVLEVKIVKGSSESDGKGVSSWQNESKSCSPKNRSQRASASSAPKSAGTMRENPCT